MILSALNDLYARLVEEEEYKISQYGFSLQKIGFVVVLNNDGSLFALQDLRTRSGRNKPKPVQMVVPGGDKTTGQLTEKSVKKRVHLLRNDLPFLVGAKKEEIEDHSGAKKIKIVPAHMEFEAFKEYHLAIKHEIDDAGFQVVCRFLETWDPEMVQEHQEWIDFIGAQGVFQVRGERRYVHDSEMIRNWWQKHLQEKSSGPKGRCLITGNHTTIAKVHRERIRGVEGLKQTAVIVGFNDPAYESYGKTQSLNAPVSEQAAFRYATALNALLDGPQKKKHRLVLGDCTIAFWTDRPTPTEDIFLQFAAEGSAAVTTGGPQDENLRQKLEAFLSALRKGSEAYTELEDAPETTSYFILGLAPNAARIVVRFFHKDSLSRLLQNLRRHFADIGIERQWGDDAKRPDPEFPPARLLLLQTAREPKDIPPILAAPLLQAIVTGARYPAGLYQAVMRRIAADRLINYPRACVIKGYLVRNLGKEVPMSLDTSRPEPAYRLGRLFAVLEKTQADAQGSGLNATIRDRFYSSASATPAAVFPRILRTYQHHLGKLDAGLRIAREKLVQEILDPIERFPAHLDLAEQGLFALGYYHQMNDLFRTKEEKAEAP